MKECRILIIDEENGELLKNELIDEELADQIAGIVEDGEVDNYEGCEQVCSEVVSMLNEAGISTENHEEMIDALGELKLIRKKLYESVETPKKIRKPKETKGKIIKRKIKGKIRTVNECACD